MLLHLIKGMEYYSTPLRKQKLGPANPPEQVRRLHQRKKMELIVVKVSTEWQTEINRS